MRNTLACISVTFTFCFLKWVLLWSFPDVINSLWWSTSNNKQALSGQKTPSASPLHLFRPWLRPETALEINCDQLYGYKPSCSDISPTFKNYYEIPLDLRHKKPPSNKSKTSPSVKCTSCHFLILTACFWHDIAK